MTDELLQGLDDAQREAVEAVRGPVCVHAGAGAGKTRTITRRIAHQVRCGVVEPQQVLALTFTERAAAELAERLGALGLDRPVRAATFHSAAYAQLRYFWPSAHGDAPLPEVQPSKVAALRRSAQRLRVEARDLAHEIEWAKVRMIAPEGYAAALDGRRPPADAETMAEVYRAYEDDKTRRGVIDYEDMLLRTAELLAEVPEAAEEVRSRYRALTVDEFQDVSPVQWELLRLWLGDSDDLCVVGDEDQTIYTFAGASSRYLTDFAEAFPHAKVVRLVDNYRSTAEVLRVANAVLAPAYVGRAPKRLRAQVDGGPEPELCAHPDGADELDGLVAWVRARLDEGVPAGEIAVAYRVNSQSEPIEAALSEAGVPHVVRGDRGFFQREEVRQAIGLLRAAADRGAPAAAPPSGVDLEGARPAAPPRTDREVERVLREQLSWHPRREPEGEAAKERWRNLGALLAVAERAVAEDPSVGLAAVVDDLERRAREGQETADPDGAVTLLTLHKAKGLEFDAVAIVACEEGLVPITHAKGDDEVAEERRLLYVGLTRARRRLRVSWAESRTGRSGKAVRRKRSRFLDGLVAAAPAPAVDDAVAERLRRWRRQRAADDGVPAYVVFPDATLHELAARQPGSRKELARVPGVGPARLERYGDELLGLLAP